MKFHLLFRNESSLVLLSGGENLGEGNVGLIGAAAAQVNSSSFSSGLHPDIPDMRKSIHCWRKR